MEESTYREKALSELIVRLHAAVRNGDIDRAKKLMEIVDFLGKLWPEALDALERRYGDREIELPDTPQDRDNRDHERHFRDEWIPELERIMELWDSRHKNLPYQLPLEHHTGLDCWQIMFDNGLSPNEAFEDDKDCWR